MNYEINGKEFTLVVKRYYFSSAGHVYEQPALEVWGSEGCECRLTVNLPGQGNVLLEAGQIFVKGSEISWTRPHLEAIGFKDTGRRVPYGNFDSVAQVWEWWSQEE